jgi:hypothetical protein
LAAAENGAVNEPREAVKPWEGDRIAVASRNPVDVEIEAGQSNSVTWKSDR